MAELASRQQGTTKTYQEVIPTPGRDEQLLVGDRVVLIYDIFQSGDWIINDYVVKRLIEECEADGRFRLIDNYYDYTGMTLELTFEVLKSGSVDTSSAPPMAASLGVVGAVLIGVAVGAVITLAAPYLYSICTGEPQRYIVLRKFAESVAANPGVPQDVTDAANEALAEADAAGGGIADAITGLRDSAKTAITLGVIALVALAVLKVR